MSCCSELIKDVFPQADPECFADGTGVEENKRKFAIKWERSGGRTLCKIKVDGCLIADSSSKKCDFVFLICPEKQFLFVELKGTDIEYGIEQIEATIAYFKSRKSISKESISAFVVSSAVPSNSNNRVREAKLRFRMTTGKELIVKNKVCDFIVR
jgi:hypothetical protein